MKLLRLLVVLCAASAVGLTGLVAQEKKEKAKKARPSPPSTVVATIEGNDISIAYSRPSVKDPRSGEVRKIWGGLVPWGKVWRTGANEATILTIAKPIKLGGFDLPAGKYSLFTVPSENGTSQLIVNKRTGQWGIPYNEAAEKDNELARLNLKRAAIMPTVDLFTITIDKAPTGGGVIKLAWEGIEFSIGFTNK